MKITSPFWHLTSAKAIIFDWDGVLAETHLDFSGLRARYFAGEQAMLLEDSVQLTPMLRANLMRDLYDLELDGAKGATPIDGSLELLEYIRKKKIPWAVVSRNCKDSIALAAKKVGVELPQFVGSRDDEVIKPDPRALWQAASSLGVAFTDCAFIGDYKYDLIGARRASMRAVLVHRNEVGWEQWYDVYYPTLRLLYEDLASPKPLVPWEYASLVKEHGMAYLKKNFFLSIKLPMADNECSPEWVFSALSLGVGHVWVQPGRVLTPSMCCAHPTWNFEQMGLPLYQVVQDMVASRFPMVTVHTATPSEKVLPMPQATHSQCIREAFRKLIEQF